MPGVSKVRLKSALLAKKRVMRFLAPEGLLKMGLKKRRGAPIENLAA